MVQVEKIFSDGVPRAATTRNRWCKRMQKYENKLLLEEGEGERGRKRSREGKRKKGK